MRAPHVVHFSVDFTTVHCSEVSNEMNDVIYGGRDSFDLTWEQFAQLNVTTMIRITGGPNLIVCRSPVPVLGTITHAARSFAACLKHKFVV